MPYNLAADLAADDMDDMRQCHADLMKALRAFKSYTLDDDKLTDLIIEVDQEIGDIIHDAWWRAARAAGEDEGVPESKEQAEWRNRTMAGKASC